VSERRSSTTFASAATKLWRPRPPRGVNTITGEGLADALAGADVLRDEGLAYGRRLDSAGVDVTMVRYENLIHDYGLLKAISQVPAVRDALHQTAEMLKRYLK
jgi:acetyl esterase/lipase